MTQLFKLYDYTRAKTKDYRSNRPYFKAYMKKYMYSMSRSNGGNVHRNKWFCVLQYVGENMTAEERKDFVAFLNSVLHEVGKNYKVGMLRSQFTMEILALGTHAGPGTMDADTGSQSMAYHHIANVWAEQFIARDRAKANFSQEAWFSNWLGTYHFTRSDCGHYEIHGEHTQWQGTRDNYGARGTYCSSCAKYERSNGTRVPNRNGVMILSEFAAQIHTRNNHTYLDDSRNGYTYNQQRQFWCDSLWTPYGDLLGGYHSSRNRGFDIIDSPWFQQNRRAFGVELEVQIRSGSLEKKLAAIHEAVNHETQQTGEYCFFERDGSIGEGFEMVTQPAGLDVHRDRLGRFLNNSQLKMGFRSHEGGACGLHVHVGREFLTQGQIYRVQSFLNDVRNEALIRSIARRYDNNYCRFKPAMAKFTIHGKHSTERYEALNVTNPETIEFRIFRGSLRYESVIASLEFVNSLLTFCTPGEVSLTQFTAIGFKQWLMQPERRSDNKFLRSYLSLDGHNDNEQTTTTAAA